MPSAAVQSRISAFESLANRDHSYQPPPLSPPSPEASRNGQHSPLVAREMMLGTPLQPTPAASHQPSRRTSPSPSPPNLGRRTSLIDLKDWVLDDGPSPPRPSGVKPKSNSNGHLGSTRTPTQSLFGAKKSPEVNAPLISFDSPPKPKPKPKPPALSSAVVNGKAPPLPPRKPSYTSLKSVASSSSAHSDSPTTSRTAFLYPPVRSDSLTVDPPHTYPPTLDHDSRSRNVSGHAPASSISSFHSVSLSSDTDPSTPGSMSNFIATFPMDREHDSSNDKYAEPDSISLTDSYENVSTSSLASPATERMISLDWEKAMAKRNMVPPQLPKRPPSTAPPSRSSIKSPPPRPLQFNSTPSSPKTAPSAPLPAPYKVRRAPPAPPSRSSTSDRSSIQSTATSYSFASSSSNSHSRASTGTYPSPATAAAALKAKRPTPVPAAARKRYEGVFCANVIQGRRAGKRKEKEKPALLSPTEARGRRAAGWRGLSVDLITGDDSASSPEKEEEVDETVRRDDRLDGRAVKLVWSRSGLDRSRLGEIWNECDPTNRGSLDVEAFAKGMWRIDEELRRAQTQVIKSASTGSLGSFRSKNTHAGFRAPMPQRSRDILR